MRRFRREDAARLIDGLDGFGFGNRLAELLRPQLAAVPMSGAVHLSARHCPSNARLRILAEAPKAEGLPGPEPDGFLSAESSHGGEIEFPGVDGIRERVHLRGVKPQGGIFYLQARAAAAFIRSLGDSTVPAYYSTSQDGLLFRL